STVPAPVAQVLAFVRLVIEDENRNVLARQDFQVAAGQTVSVSGNGDSLLAADRRTAQIHAFTQTAGGAADAFPFVIPGLGIVDNTSGGAGIHLDTKINHPRPRLDCGDTLTLIPRRDDHLGFSDIEKAFVWS